MNGFLGKHLSDQLFNQGYKVAGFPRESLFDIEKVTAVLDEVKPDYIFHLASYGNHSDQQDENQVLISNVLATFFLLSANKTHKAKFFNFSSSSVYGDKSKAMKEDHLPETTSFYGCSKVASEYLAKAFSYKFGFPVITIRPFSVYGEGESENRLIPTIVKKILTREEMTLEPDATHDWIYVQDFVDGVMALMQAKSNGVYNIGTGIETSNLEVLKNIERIMQGKAIVKNIVGLREQKPKVWRANTNKMEKLGFKPNNSLEVGLYKTVPFYIAKFVEESAKK